MGCHADTFMPHIPISLANGKHNSEDSNQDLREEQDAAWEHDSIGGTEPAIKTQWDDALDSSDETDQEGPDAAPAVQNDLLDEVERIDSLRVEDGVKEYKVVYKDMTEAWLNADTGFFKKNKKHAKKLKRFINWSKKVFLKQGRKL